MKSYSEEEIGELISCPKVITDPPKREMRLERGSRRNNMRLRSQSDDREFSVFLRINEAFQENFSIGLEYSPRDERGSFCLLRCNGPHGEFVGSTTTSHFRYHIHRAKAENIEGGLRAERSAEATDAYASYTHALLYFLKVINVLNAEEYFQGLSQMSLPLGSEQEKPEL